MAPAQQPCSAFPLHFFPSLGTNTQIPLNLIPVPPLAKTRTTRSHSSPWTICLHSCTTWRTPSAGLQQPNCLAKVAQKAWFCPSTSRDTACIIFCPYPRCHFCSGATLALGAPRALVLQFLGQRLTRWRLFMYGTGQLASIVLVVMD